jgi:hypothetical protein
LERARPFAPEAIGPEASFRSSVVVIVPSFRRRLLAGWHP